MLELLVKPYRYDESDETDNIYALLSTYPHLDWQPVSLGIADRAAQVRADINLKTPDAIQAATALIAGATGLISNDPAFRRVTDLEVMILDDLLKNSTGG